MSASEPKVITAYTTNGGPGAPPQDGTWTGGGGDAGIWMGGSAIASDHFGRVFFVTGNAGEDRSIKIYLHPDVSLFTRSVNAWSVWLPMHQQAL